MIERDDQGTARALRSASSRIGALALFFVASTVTSSAFAQTAPAPGAPPTTPGMGPGPAVPAPPAPAPAAPRGPSLGPTPSPGISPSAGVPRTAPMGPGAPRETPTQTPELMQAVPGGITADQVGQRAAATSYQAKAASENASAAEARTDAAVANFVPRVSLLGRYTRLSSMTPPQTCVPGLGCFGFPLVFDNWLAQASITIPISDYFLRINQSYTAATKVEEAARHDVAAARAKSFSDGKIAYYAWLRARGGLSVAEQSFAVAQAHLKDAQNQFAVGNASKADVLRAQTQVAAASLAVERAKSGIVIAERQVRVATHAPEDEKLAPGESLDTTVQPAPQNVRALVSEAFSARPEVKSIDKNAESTRKLASAQRAGRYPSVSGFGDLTYSNPNPRRFPQRNEWFPTWQVGAQISWSPNDILSAGPQANDLEARASALDAQKAATRDGIELEVTQAYQAVVEADTAIETTTRQLESAEEGYRVARELFNAGRGTSTTLIDAETALAQTRFDHLNAKVDARIARIRLEHALGRDVK